MQLNNLNRYLQEIDGDVLNKDDAVLTITCHEKDVIEVRNVNKI